MMDKKDIIRNVETCIKKLKDKFEGYAKWDDEEKDMLSFCGEKYLHYLLYEELKKIKLNKNYDLKMEWPTNQRYKKHEITEKDGRSARFDLAIIDENKKPVVAIEFAFQPETITPKERTLSSAQFSQHAKNDSKKLCNEKIRHPYILAFILKTAGENRTQKKIKSYQKNKENFENELSKIDHSKLKILFIEVDIFKRTSYERPFPEGWLI